MMFSKSGIPRAVMMAAFATQLLGRVGATLIINNPDDSYKYPSGTSMTVSWSESTHELLQPLVG